MKAPTLGSAFNVLCTVVGTGLINLPKGFAQSGWIGVPLLTLMGIMAGYTAKILVDCMQYFGNGQKSLQDPLMEEEDEAGGEHRSPSYGDIGQAAFGTFGRWFVTIQMHLTLTMVGCIYHLLAALNLSDLLSISQPIAVLIVAGVVWFHVFLHTMSEVAILSYFNFSINVALAIVVVYCTVTHAPEEKAHTDFVIADGLSLGGAFASFGFSFGAHPILPDVYASMQRPEQYTFMCLATFAVALLVFYLPVACVGYSTYGDLVESPIYETPQLKGVTLVKVIIALLTTHLLMSYVIVLNPPELALESTLNKESTPMVLWKRMGLRTCFVGLTSLIAWQVPISLFGSFLDLVSAFTSTFTVYILPSVFYVKLRGPSRMHPLELLFNCAIILFSLVGSVFGTIGAIEELAGL